MNDRIYNATVTFEDGEEIRNEGSISEVSDWADRSSRGKGSCKIEIRTKANRQENHKEVGENGLS